jgi:putative transcriptional regulator
MTKTIGQQIIEGLQEAIALERGVTAGATVKRIPITARHASADAPPDLTRQRIAAIRRRLRLSQPVFARALNVSPETVKKWEQGVYEPEGASRRLLQIAASNPSVLLAYITPRRRPRRRTVAI